MDIADWFQ
ncbi:RNA polymerase II-associated factor 1, partial [Araneus ventricosus]